MTGFPVAPSSLTPPWPCWEEKAAQAVLTPTVDVEADTGFGQTIHVVASGASLDLHRGVPQAAVPFEAGTGLALHNAIAF